MTSDRILRLEALFIISSLKNLICCSTAKSSIFECMGLIF